MNSMQSHDDELEEIEALHRRDVEAVLAGDKDTLASLWSSDGVMLAPGSPALRGDELLAALKAETDDAAYEVIDYRFDFDEISIFGNHAFEWGTVSGSARDLESGVVTESAYKLMRILIREAGEWKVHRAIWNALD